MKTNRFWVVVVLFFSLSVLGQAQPTLHQVISDMISEVSEDQIREHIQILEDAGGTRSRLTFTAGKDSAAVYIKKAFDNMPGLTSVELDTFYIPHALTPYNTKPQVNVVATIRGSLYPDEIYVIGAHYDSTADRDGTATWNSGENWLSIEAPGANDNGSGVAALLEIARVMSDPNFPFRSKRTIKLVAFGAEERGVVFTGGHYGSIHMAQTARRQNLTILGMISVDMIGFNDHFDFTSFVRVNNPRASESEILGARLAEANHNFFIGLRMRSPLFNTGNFGVYSDHQSFADEGFPAILVIENAAPWNTRIENNTTVYVANPYYHKTSDTWDRINMRLVRKVAQMNLAALASLNGEVATSISGSDEIAHRLTLEQNYPNPFNPTTTIRFNLPQSGWIKLEVYNVLGQLVSVLAEGNFPSGEHHIRFEAASMNSGHYIYRLSSESTTLTRTMTLIK